MRSTLLHKPRVVVADDSADMVSVVTQVLSRYYNVVGRVLNGAQAFDAVLCLRPDVVVLDIQMPELDGIQVARRLQAAGSTAKIVFLTSLEDTDYMANVVNLGAHGYVFKVRCYLDLPEAIEAALDGSSFHSTSPENVNAGGCLMTDPVEVAARRSNLQPNARRRQKMREAVSSDDIS